VYLEDLKHDFRNLLYPYTAKNLVELKKNKIKDYVGAAGQYGVSHMVVFTQTENHNYMRVIKNPQGPTITFKITEYALARDVIKH
jgi:ribosome biogenesis protein SSF1/2